MDIIKYTINIIKTKYSEYKVSYSITTNGTIITDEIIKIFKENNFAILLSIDGYDNDFNLRKFKNGRKSVTKVIENINKLKNNGIFPKIRATLLNTNPYIAETYDFFEKLELPFNIVFTYASENKTHNFSLYTNDILEKIKFQLDTVLKYYIEKIKRKDILYNSLFKDLFSIFRFRIKKQIVCSAGQSYYTIISNGDIFSCSHFINDSKFKIGNINGGKIYKKDFIPLPLEEIKDCKLCWAKYLCLGGCPAQKLSMDKKINESFKIENCELEKICFEFYLKLYYFVTQLAPEYIIKEPVEKVINE